MNQYKRSFIPVGVIILLTLLISCTSKVEKKSEEAPKILMHYMGWYNDTISENGDELRHWEFGHANEPKIGLYDSHSESLLKYHMLLSWASGIDGIVINIKDDYDDVTMRKLIKVINELQAIDSVNFDYGFAISYDDQGFDLSAPYDTAITKLSYLRDSILPEMTNYIMHEEQPVIFSFDYPNKYLSAKSFRSVINDVFDANKPLLIWNTLVDVDNEAGDIDAYYPWVQPGASWDYDKGLRWGKEFLDYFYPEVNKVNTNGNYKFTCGGVWPGFDDRKNESWGGDRLMARQSGIVYDSTWAYVHNYEGKLPMKFVVIETWNDWNEGTEVEPSEEDGYNFLLRTIDHANKLKGSEISKDSIKFEAAKLLYHASLLVESKKCDNHLYKHKLEKAIERFLNKEFKESIILSSSILNKLN